VLVYGYWLAMLHQSRRRRQEKTRCERERAAGTSEGAHEL
jgi:hypothetical protein